MAQIYTHPTQPKVDVPNLDLTSLLFDSEYTLSQDDTVLHVDAAHPDHSITKSDLRALYERIAHGLRTTYNIGRRGPNKDIVTVISYGQILVPAAFYGIIAAGGVYSAASPSSTAQELARQVNMGKSTLLICGREHRAVALAAASQCGLGRDRILVLESVPFRSLARLDGSGSALSAPDKRLPAEKITDPAKLRESVIVILWSSGTTGLPKGVMLSHRNMVAETYITSLSGRQFIANEIAAGRMPETIPYRSLGHLPISHIAGLWSYNIGPQYAGGCVYWMGKYRWADLLKYARKYRVTVFYTVPSIYLRIAKSAEVTDHFAWVVGAATGAAPMDGELQVAANRKLADGKEQMLGQTWGLSETTGAVTAVPAGDSDTTGSIGSVLPGVELRLVDEQMRDVKPGMEGELLVRSELVMRGYFDNEKATKEAFHGDWFCTGDIGVVRENGKIYIVDRKKELLKYKGLQVAPAELEGLLCRHPEIKEAAVIGLPDPSAGDLPRAYVVREAGSKITADEVKRYVAAEVAPYKQLRGGVAFIDEIPKNAVGKILRRDLRERAKKEVSGAKL